MGSVSGLFVATEDEIDKNIGRDVHLGEALGKHSEVYGTLDRDDLELILEDESAIAALRRAVGGDLISGYNPLDYIEDTE